MSTTLVPIAGAAEGKLNFLIFDQHQSKLRELYLEQNKSLVQVKKEMEAYHGFPETGSKIYEYGLRHLGFIKKLPVEGWIEVDVCAKKRKEREGKETDVYLSGIQHSWDSIKRRISRHKKGDQMRKRICRRPTPDLPERVELKTPPLSPGTMVNAPQRNATQIRTSPLGLPTISIISGAGLQSQQLSDGILGRMLSNPSSTAHWLPEVPSSQLVYMFRQIIEIGPSALRHREHYEIDAFNFPWSSTHTHRITPTPYLRQGLCNVSLHVNSITQDQLYSMEALSKLCTILANGDQLEIADTREMLAWIAMDANKQTLKVFFALDLPAVAASWTQLIRLARQSKSGDAFRTLVEIGFEIHNGEWIEQHITDLIKTMVMLGSKRVGNLARRLLSVKLPRPVLSSDINSWLWDVIKLLDVELLSTFLDAGFKFRDQKFTKYEARMYRDSFYSTAPSQRQQLIALVENAGFDFDQSPSLSWAIDNVYRGFNFNDDSFFRHNSSDTSWSFLDELWWSGDYEFYESVTFNKEKTKAQITVSGLIIAASSGIEQLRLYLDSKSIEEHAGRKLLLETALSLAAGLGKISAIRSFGEAKVDPNARVLLLHNKGFELDWHPLMRAAGGKHLGAVRLLVELGTEINLNIVGFNPLSAAVWNSEPRPLLGTGRLAQLETVRYFLGGNLPRAYVVDAMIKAVTLPYRSIDQDDYGPPLPDSALDEEIIDMLLEAGIRFDEITVRGKDVLHHIINQGCNLNAVNFLLSRGAQIPSGSCPGEMETMLHSAVASLSKDSQLIVQLLLRNGASCAEEWDGSIIFESALPDQEDYPDDSEGTRRLQLFSFLLEKGAQVNGPEILAHLLHYNAPDDLIYRTIQAGADVNPSLSTAIIIKYLPLQLAALRGRLDVARRLVDRGADINAPAAIFRGRTALQAACNPDGGREIHMGLIQYLINNGADINAPAALYYGCTALQAACNLDGGREIHMGLIQYLINNGASINAPAASYYGRTALQAACKPYRDREIHMGLIQFLIDNGADVNASAGYIGGVTALQCAIVKGSMTAVCLLLDAGANVHAGSDCQSILDIAAVHGRLDMVDILLRKGAESYMQRQSPYDRAIRLAIMYRHFPIAKMLEKKLAERN
ncbi:ankyrin [Xylaria castorea]|nr:ankyrin [Xylaria castorea]